MSEHELISQLTSSAIVIYVIQWLKGSRLFPFITQESKRLNRWLMVAGSFLSAIGVHFAYDGKAGALLITGLTVAGIAHGCWHWLNSLALTQVIYDSTLNQPAATVTVPSSLPGGAV